ncbi:N-acetylgalactosaminyltransferase 6 [Chrysoperla carnea]|uniref:N-acetylgalactosaminyltransferase 6 n=1 Tax=Chrysoperla carnea TaxID=189513 RepID=UPI001D06D852|nr:N-acetylgalactosaminyltransferase 6 [Chrysoperla carnea]
MRRNIVSLIKFVVIAGLTISCTVLTFKIIRSPEYENNELILVPSFRERDKTVRIDYHDTQKIFADKERTGLGEHGIAANISIPEALKKSLYDQNGFNAALSDLISVERSLPDIRHPGCKKKFYLKDLPKVSVIIPFYNEHWSTLLRTVYSVYNRSPEELLVEIILVDDGSTKKFLKQQLDDYLKVNLTKTSVIHLEHRWGLIRARLAGAKVAKGDVLVFLDSHTEANVNWLPPLLEPIALDYRTCVCPFIDVIDYETFNYRAQDEGARGAFDWNFDYKRLNLLSEDKKHPSEPFRSPIMAGGLFAISAKFFWELGGYDEELVIWGGEQYELSFKIWQCHGQMYDAPCSRVGHIYRKFVPFPNPGIGDFLAKNYRRVAEVWMDEYAEYLYMRHPYYRSIDPGDLTLPKSIRTKLQCKSFKWFIENIAFDLVVKYPPVEPNDFAKGRITSAIDPELCINVDNEKQNTRIDLKTCSVDDPKLTFSLSWHKDIRVNGGKMCWDVATSHKKAPVLLYGCHGDKGNQYWYYDEKHKWLVHGEHDKRCLDADFGRKQVYMSVCDKNSPTQKWQFEIVDSKALESGYQEKL